MSIVRIQKLGKKPTKKSLLAVAVSVAFSCQTVMAEEVEETQEDLQLSLIPI